MKTILFTLVLGMIIGGYISWSIKPEKECPEPSTSIQYDTTYIRHDSIAYKPVPVVKLQKVNVDSIYQVAKKYWEQFYNNEPVDFVARIDSNLTTPDSSLSGSIAFVSRIPLDPIGYFKTDLKVREKIITNTIVQTEDVGFFYKRFIPYLGIGLSYNGKTVEPAIQLGFGVRIN